MKFYIHTFGCQMNEYDSEKMAGVLTNGGYDFADSEKDADIIVVNTCSVRKLAEEKAFSYIGTAVKTKKVIVAGCMAQSMKEELIKTFPKLHAVIGTFNFSEIKKAVENKKRKVYADENYDDEFPEIARNKSLTGFVAIMRGCDNFCSYCIVPHVRGRERSRDAVNIISEIKDMVSEGCLDIMLLGQNVNSYHDEDSGITFSELLKQAAGVEGLERVRFMTSHPKDLNSELIEAVAGNEKICSHFHLPVQAGSNSVLKRMNRKYTIEEYKDKVKQIREAIPDVTLTTDILVGFPGESPDDFDGTYSTVKELRFDSAYVFKYSEREGTKAVEFGDDVDKDEKTRRINAILDLQKQITDEINIETIGKIQSVLIIEQSDRESSYVVGTNQGNKKVFVKGNNDLIGKLINVKITGTKGLSLEGEIV